MTAPQDSSKTEGQEDTNKAVNDSLEQIALTLYHSYSGADGWALPVDEAVTNLKRLFATEKVQAELQEFMLACSRYANALVGYELPSEQHAAFVSANAKRKAELEVSLKEGNKHE